MAAPLIDGRSRRRFLSSRESAKTAMAAVKVCQPHLELTSHPPDTPRHETASRPAIYGPGVVWQNSAYSAEEKTLISHERWFLGGPPTRSRRIQLLCLPHSGGGASSYRYWLEPLSAVIDIRAVQFPGRENRRAEPFVTDGDVLLRRLTDAVMATSQDHLALFGHSLGAVIATRLCMALESRGRTVRALFVSGHAGPTTVPGTSRSQTAQRFSDILTGGKLGLVDALIELGAMPEYVRDNAGLQALLVPAIRADLRLIADEFLGTERVRAPITVLAGADDPLLTGLDFAGWGTVSPGGCPVYRIPGGHFYLADHREQVAQVIRRRLGLDAPQAAGTGRVIAPPSQAAP
jgi:surfactin synthase thioesterase subunit